MDENTDATGGSRALPDDPSEQIAGEGDGCFVAPTPLASTDAQPLSSTVGKSTGNGRCCLCSTDGPLVRGANGERMCADAIPCIARVKVVIFRAR